ncbi:hypothetical protein DICVIV_08720 [Dictyocaulus viviparus]|uniref:Nuclear condensin complex subunit 3 C-terminal domain-containing protein n=1 Tax=Dictyocaulus viviparus TaxID=29172 RepID=A0A0D8XL37_DICVI|nr:hypothetical protein DICVIV_08720 [Dictyocaulus viviparus]
MNQWRKGVLDFVIFLMDFCETLCHCENPAVRQNICTLVGFLLKEGRCTDTACGNSLSMNVRRKFYSILMERQLDKVVAVRAEVIQSVADIQDDEIPNDFVEALERSPKDIILMGFRDVAADCRLTAVYALRIIIHSHTDFLIELVSSDPSVKVRVAVIRKFARLDFTFLTEQQRMDILRAVIFDDDPSVVDVVRDVLLSEWLYFVHSIQKRKTRRESRKHPQLRDKKVERDKVNGDNKSHVISDSQEIKCDHGLGSAALGLLAMLDFCDELQSEYICRRTLFSLFDVIRKKLHFERNSLTNFVSSLVNDNTFPEVLSTHNYRTLLDESLSRTDQAQYAFFWRILIEYCFKRAHTESEYKECTYMLAPPLHVMCELVQKMRMLPLQAEDCLQNVCGEVPVCDIQQITIIHLLGVLRHLDRNDLLGMNEWKSLLLSLLEDDSLSKEVTDCVMIDLVDVFFQGKPEQFLATVYDVAFESIQRPKYNNSKDSKLLLTAVENKQPHSVFQFSECEKKFYIQLLHSMLRTGIFTKFSLMLRRIYDNIIRPCFCLKGTQFYIWALEAAGILSIISEEMAMINISEALDAFNSNSEKMQVSAMDVVTDLISVYGYENICSWSKTGQFDAQSIRRFSSALLGVIRSKNVDALVCSKACECMSKILLMESIANEVFHFADVVAGLISRLFHSRIFRLTGMKTCLEKFFSMFSSIRRSNQIVVIAAFHQLMSDLRKASDDDFVLRIDIVGALEFIVSMTRVDLLTHAPDTEMGSVQPIFMREILEYLLHHPNDPCASLYWHTASLLDLKSFSYADIIEVQNTAQRIIENAISTTLLRNTFSNEVHKFIRYVESTLHSLVNRDSEVAEHEDCLTELGEKSVRTLGRRRKQISRSTNSTPSKPSIATVKKRRVISTVKRSTQQLLSNDKSPSPSPICQSLITPIARSRPVLSRNAKNIAVNKTRRWLFENENWQNQ